MQFTPLVNLAGRDDIIHSMALVMADILFNGDLRLNRGPSLQSLYLPYNTNT